MTVSALSDNLVEGITTQLIYHTAYGQLLPVVGVTVYDEDVASMTYSIHYGVGQQQPEFLVVSLNVLFRDA